MRRPIRIGLVGDYNKGVVAHGAIPKALKLAGQMVGCDPEFCWLATASLNQDTDYSGLSGIWCVPGSPYANMAGALHAIRFAREYPLPFLGTCGGFQHAVIEYARNVLGHAEADHAESNPAAAMPLISPLVCSLVGSEGEVLLKAGSSAARLYGKLQSRETYNCSYGVNPNFRSLLDDGRLGVSGWDRNQEARIIELEGHCFFMASLFQPERAALKGAAHPLIIGFLQSQV